MVHPDNQTVNFSKKVPSQDESELTLVHVPREASQDSAQGSRVEKVHGTEQEAVEELVMEHGGSLDGALSTQSDTARVKKQTQERETAGRLARTSPKRMNFLHVARRAPRYVTHMLHVRTMFSEGFSATVALWGEKKKIVCGRQAVKFSIIMSVCEADIKVRT